MTPDHLLLSSPCPGHSCSVSTPGKATRCGLASGAGESHWHFSVARSSWQCPESVGTSCDRSLSPAGCCGVAVPVLGRGDLQGPLCCRTVLGWLRVAAGGGQPLCPVTFRLAEACGDFPGCPAAGPSPGRLPPFCLLPHGLFLTLGFGGGREGGRRLRGDPPSPWSLSLFLSSSVAVPALLRLSHPPRLLMAVQSLIPPPCPHQLPLLRSLLGPTPSDVLSPQSPGAADGPWCPFLPSSLLATWLVWWIIRGGGRLGWPLLPPGSLVFSWCS